MPTQILMPALSPTMTEGNLVKWLVKEGDTVKAGDLLAEIETDKATIEFEAADEGTLGQILVAEGTEGVAVNAPIAVLLGDGEDTSAVPASAPAASESVPAAVSVRAEAQSAAIALPPRANGEIKASPLARRMAHEQNLPLERIPGSGPSGRIVRRDVERIMREGLPVSPAAGIAPATAATAQPSAVPAFANAPKLDDPMLAGLPGYELVPHTGMRKTIASRLTASKQTVPHFYLTIDCELDTLLETRKQINVNAPQGVKISVNDFAIKAAALALMKVPDANAAYTQDGILRFNSADISVAVAIPNGLITPIIREAHAKSLAQISAEMADLAKRARDGRLKPMEFTGGTFSISNLGMFGIKAFDAVINPPQGAILAVGAGEQRPAVKNGQLVVATVMSCTMSVDHRVIDGALGAQWLAVFKTLIENPALMLL